MGHRAWEQVKFEGRPCQRERRQRVEDCKRGQRRTFKEASRCSRRLASPRLASSETVKGLLRGRNRYLAGSGSGVPDSYLHPARDGRTSKRTSTSVGAEVGFLTIPSETYPYQPFPESSQSSAAGGAMPAAGISDDK